MLFGVTRRGDESFDLVTEIDLDKSTITVECKATNRATKNYEVSSWDIL